MEGSQSRRGAPATAEQLRAEVWDLLRGREYSRASALLETCRSKEKDVVRSLWYEVQYMKLKEQLGKSKLTAVQRFRCRKRNPLPCSLRVEEFKTRTLPREAREQLKAWARGNSASPSMAERDKLMEETRLNKQQISNWFANYRRKLKKAASQQESVGELNQSPASPQHSMRSPQISVGGSGWPPVSDNYTAEHFEWIKSEPQTSVMDYTAATRPGLSIPQCCTSGPPCHQLFLPETDPATLLNAASGYWCQPAEASHSLAQPHVPLCPCMSMAVTLAQTPQLMVTSQPAFPHRLFQTALWSSGQFESAAALEQFYPSQDLLHQGSWSLCNRGHLSPHDASPFHPFSNIFLTNVRQSDVRELLREEMVHGSYLHMMCPGIGNANQILLEGSTKGDSSWPGLSPSSASHYQAPFLDGRILAPGGFGGPEESEAGTEGMPLCVDGDGARSYRGGYAMDVVVNSGHWMTDCPNVTLDAGLNQPSQATLGGCSEDCSPQSNIDGVKIDCRRLTFVKVETEVWCHPQHSQVQQDTKLDIAAQALIQLSQIPTCSLSTPDGTASTGCQRTWES